MIKSKMLLGKRILPNWLGFMIAVLFDFLLGPGNVWAGPPFVTDDPRSIEYRHWEIYVASRYEKNDDISGTAPHFEIDYGVWPNLQLHLIIPFSYEKPQGQPMEYGLGDMELGVLYRFIQETTWLPLVGTFPLMEIPTGDSSRGLGGGTPKVFFPIWLQKSWGPWTSYGGGGYWYNPGSDNRNYWFAGWVAQRAITKWLTVGAEVFYESESTVDQGSRTAFNIGAIINFTENHHFIFSAGKDLHGPTDFAAYAAYLWTFGPSEKKGNTPLRPIQVSLR